MATTKQTNSTLEEIANVLKAGDDFVICGHVSPDGDCLGSQLALYHALRALGKRATCVLVRDEPLGCSLEFLPGVRDMVPAASFTGACGVFVGVDVPSRERIGDAASILDSAATSVTIDHHAADIAMCEHVYVDPSSASASIIVWEVVKLLLERPPLECALCAYTGLITDTGGFRFQNTGSRAFEVAAELVSYGVDPALVATESFGNRTLASLKLESLAIERLVTFAGGQAAISWIRQADIDRYGAIKADTEPLVVMVRSLHGVRVACMLREQDGQVRGSLRSKDGIDISVLARELGGGGHKAASGFTADLPLEDTVEFLVEKITDLIAKEQQA